MLLFQLQTFCTVSRQLVPKMKTTSVSEMQIVNTKVHHSIGISFFHVK